MYICILFEKNVICYLTLTIIQYSETKVKIIYKLRRDFSYGYLGSVIKVIN